MCDADYGAPGARAANEKGILAITCAGAPGIGKQMIGPLTFNTYTGSPTESAGDAEFAYRTMGWRRAYFLCDRALEYTKVVCEAFKTRWKELGGEVAGEDTFLQSDTSIASQVTRLKNAAKPDFLVLASYPGGSPAIKEIRAAYDGPIVLSAAYSGTFWLKPTPHLSNVWVAAVGSSYGDDPRAAVNAFFRHFEEMTGKAAVVDSYPLLGYSLVQTIAKGVEIAGTTDGKALGKALETFNDEPLLAGPTTYTESCHVPVQRPLLIIRYEDGKPRSTGKFVRPEKVPPYPC
jgi:branched-chain amino acid transport system substrate-binding protein